MANIFITIVVWVYITSIMFSVGLQITPNNLKRSLSQYALIGRVILINIIIIPLIAWLFTFLFPMNLELAVGFILAVISIGSPFSPRLTAKVGGDFILSASITLALILISFVSIPLTLFFISFAYPAIFVRPFLVLVPLLIFQLAPIVVGMVIKYKWENLVAKILKYLRYVILISLILIIIIAIISAVLVFTTLFGSLSIIAATILIVITAVLSFLFGGKSTKTRRTMCVSSVSKDGAAGMLIITFNIPEATEAIAIVLAYVLIFVVLYYVIAKLFFKKDISDPNLDQI